MAHVRCRDLSSEFNESSGSDIVMHVGNSPNSSYENVISSTPKITRRLLFDDSNDIAEEDESEVDETTNNLVTMPTMPSYSPPYRKVRELRLLDQPLTPKTLTTNSPCTPLRPSRLFSSPGGKQPVNENKDNLEVPVVNVNPFTPQALNMRSNKRRRDSNSPGLQSSMSDIDTMEDLIDTQPPTKKRTSLKNNNISRYQHEFAEISLLGSGQFSQVFKCINRLDGCIYAVKRSKKPVAGSFTERAALNEVWAHAVLDWHENVVGYHSAWAEHNYMYIQTEYCNRGTLTDKITKESLEFPECQRLMQQIAEGLAYMHSHSLVHLDIKPDNIFLSVSKRKRRSPMLSNDSADDGFAEDEELIYKIGDLGHVTSLSALQVEEGDCRYLPLEVLQENYSDLTKADIFSLGLTVMEAAGYGKLPLNGDEWQQLRAGVIPKDMKYLPADFVDLLKTMIDPNPRRRPSAEEVLLYRKRNLTDDTNKLYEELHREYKANLLKNQLLTKQLEDAKKYIKSITPDTKRLVGKKMTRSVSLMD